MEADIDRVIIAGAFGTFIDVQSAVAIGMLPPLPLERYQQVVAELPKHLQHSFVEDRLRTRVQPTITGEAPLPQMGIAA